MKYILTIQPCCSDLLSLAVMVMVDLFFVNVRLWDEQEHAHSLKEEPDKWQGGRCALGTNTVDFIQTSL